MICMNYDNNKKFGLLQFHLGCGKFYLNSPKGYSRKLINAQTEQQPSSHNFYQDITVYFENKMVIPIDLFVLFHPKTESGIDWVAVVSNICVPSPPKQKRHWHKCIVGIITWVTDFITYI